MGHKIWDKTQYHGHGYGQDNQRDQACEEHGMVASATTSEKQRVSIRGSRILFLIDNDSNELKGHNENIQQTTEDMVYGSCRDELYSCVLV